MVSTKKGKKNQKPTLQFSYNTTFSSPINTIETLNSTQFKSFYDQLLRNSVEGLNNGRVPFYFDYDLMNMGQIDIDWNTFEYTYNGLLPEAFGDADVNWNKEVYKQMALSQQANSATLEVMKTPIIHLALGLWIKKE